MKKTYIQPTMEVEEMATDQSLLETASFAINSKTEDAVEEEAQLSRSSHYIIWDDDE